MNDITKNYIDYGWAGKARPEWNEKPMENKDLIIEALVRALDFEERCYQFVTFCNESFPNNGEWVKYYRAKWEKAEDLFPDVATLFPVPTPKTISEWFGDDPEDQPSGTEDARDRIYEEALDEWLGEKAVDLRRTALAKARGESS